MKPFRTAAALLIATGILSPLAVAAEPIEILVQDRAQAIVKVQGDHMGELAVMARMPVVNDYFLAADKDRKAKLKAVQAALAGRHMGSELCLIDEHGSEHLRAVHGHLAPDSELAHNEVEAPFFKDGIHLAAGQSYQSPPYASPDVHEWVLGYVVPVLPGKAILHFEHPLKEIQALATQGMSGENRFLLVIDDQGLIYGDSRRNVNLSTTGDSPDPSANFQNLARSEPRLPPALIGEIVNDVNHTTKTAWNGGTWEVSWRKVGSLILVGFQRQ